MCVCACVCAHVSVTKRCNLDEMVEGEEAGAFMYREIKRLLYCGDGQLDSKRSIGEPWGCLETEACGYGKHGVPEPYSDRQCIENLQGAAERPVWLEWNNPDLGRSL